MGVAQQVGGWSLSYAIVAVLAVFGFFFAGVYRPEGSEPRPPQAVPQRMQVRLDNDTAAEQQRTVPYVVPLHSLDERSSPLNRETQYIADKENPFSGQTADRTTGWSKADPDAGRDRQRNTPGESLRSVERNRTELPETMFPVDRARVQNLSAEQLRDLLRALAPFQDLPQAMRPDSELTVNFDSRGQISLGTMANQHAEYFFRMVRKISEQWNMYFPKFQHYYGMLKEGEVLVVFELDLDGRVSKIELAKSYGQSTLDAACLAAIREAGVFGPIPAEFRTKGKMVIPFLFVYHRPDQPLRMFH